MSKSKEVRYDTWGLPSIDEAGLVGRMRCSSVVSGSLVGRGLENVPCA